MERYEKYHEYINNNYNLKNYKPKKGNDIGHFDENKNQMGWSKPK